MKPSRLIEIENRTSALAFDIACAARLKIYDEQIEKARLEAMSGGALANALVGSTGPRPTVERNKPIVLNA